MAGCFNFANGGNVSEEDRKKWTDRLQNVLDSPTAQRRFSDFLEKRDLEAGRELLKFWGNCQEFLSEANGYDEVKLLEEAQKIVKLADDKINLTAEMYTLNDAVKSRDINKIKVAITAAQKEAATLLQDEGYKEFRAHLLPKNH